MSEPRLPGTRVSVTRRLVEWERSEAGVSGMPPQGTKPSIAGRARSASGRRAGDPSPRRARLASPG